MENEWKTKGRVIFLSRRPSGSSLLRIGLYCLICSILLATAVLAFFSVQSCGRLRDPIADEVDPFTPVDSLKIEITTGKDILARIRHLDVFIFSAKEPRKLEGHLRITEPQDIMTIPCTDGKKILVLVANSPKAFNTAAIPEYGSMELVSFSFVEDNPQEPVMSDWFQTVPPSCVNLDLKPLMSCVVLDEITNGMDGYRCLEDPVIYLTNVNPSALILKSSDFRPESILENPERVSLPYDIGFYTQKPGTILYCYPNDTPANILGSPRTGMILECGIRDTTGIVNKAEFSLELPPVDRADTIHVSMEVFSDCSFRYSAF